MWPGTRVVEGTRFVKVKFTDTVKSLPYSTRFDTEMGAQYFRVIHDRQVKVCRMCIQPGHIVRECPEFRCRNCGGQGHYARECDQWEPKCKKCGKKESNCVCKGGEGKRVARLGLAAGFAGARPGAPGGTDLDPLRRKAGRGRVSRRAEGAGARRAHCRF